jgi:hypothetical protein
LEDERFKSQGGIVRMIVRMETILEALKAIQATQAQHTEAFRGVSIALELLRNDVNALKRDAEAIHEDIGRLQASYNNLAVRVAVLEQC